MKHHCLKICLQNITFDPKCFNLLNMILIINSTNKLLNSSIFWIMSIQNNKQPSFLRKIDIYRMEFSIVPSNTIYFCNVTTISINCNNIIKLLYDMIHRLYSVKSSIENNKVLAIEFESNSLMSTKGTEVGFDSNIPWILLFGKHLVSLQYTIPCDENFLSKLIINRIMIRLAVEPNYNLLEWTDLDKHEDVNTPNNEQHDDTHDESTNYSTSNNSIEDKSRNLNNLNVQSETEENWNISDDSADEFDPHENKEPTAKRINPYILYKWTQQTFCPADLHQKCTSTRIREMIQKGTLNWSVHFEDGQFDDP